LGRAAKDSLIGNTITGGNQLGDHAATAQYSVI
jgi:hypothetical protein